MKTKKNYSLILAIVACAVLFYSGFSDAFFINGDGVKIYTVTGFSIVMFCYIIYVYGLAINKKMVYIISYLFGLLGYLYSLYIIFVASGLAKLFLESSDIPVYDARMGNGTYIYLGSGILFLISILLPKKKKIEESVSEDVKVNNVTDKVDNNYILCKYIYGCKDLKSFSNGILRINNNNTLSLIVLNDNNSTQEAILICDYIKDINVKASVGFSEEKEEDNSFANTALVMALFGTSAGVLAQTYFSQQVESYGKIKENVIYEINFVFDNENIMIQTKIDPKEFISKIKINK